MALQRGTLGIRRKQKFRQMGKGRRAVRPVSLLLSDVSVYVCIALGAAVFQLGSAVPAEHGSAVAAVLYLVHGLNLAAVKASELANFVPPVFYLIFM